MMLSGMQVAAATPDEQPSPVHDNTVPGALSIQANGIPMALAAWASHLPPEEVVESWKQTFARYHPASSRYGVWTTVGAPIGNHWLALQIRPQGKGSVGWQVMMPLQGGAVSATVAPGVLPAGMRPGAQFSSKADGRLSTTTVARSFGSLSALGMSLVERMKARGYTVDASMAPASERQRQVLRFVKGREEVLAILAVDRSDVVVVTHQVQALP